MGHNEADGEDYDGVDVIIIDDDDERENENEVIKIDGRTRTSSSSESSKSDISESESDDDEATDGGSSGSPIKKSKPVVEEVEETEDRSSDSDSDAYNDDNEVVITLDDEDEKENEVIKNDGRNRTTSSESSSEISKSESDEDDDETNDEVSSRSPIKKSKPVVAEVKETEDSNSGSDSDSADTYTDDDEVITLDDDEDDEKKVAEALSSKPMICYRCPAVAKKAVLFSDPAMYLFHVKRHRLGECFACPTCKRPFTKLNICVAHEIMVHGTKIPLNCYNKNDPVISAALEFGGKSISGGGEPSTSQGNNDNALVPSSNGTLKTGENALPGENDNYEIDINNNDHIVTSTSFQAYRGPPVTHILECYEIQLNHCRRKDARANHIAKIAINVHKQNVEEGRDEYRLGRFPMRDDSDHVKKLSRQLGSGETTTGNSSDAGLPRASDRKRKREDESRKLATQSTSQSPRRSCISGLVQRVCRRCDYTWTTAEDLHQHRERMHPNVRLFDLLPFAVADSSVKSRKPLSPVKKVTFSDVSHASPRKQNERGGVRGNVAIKSLSKAINPVPVPNSSFTDKERFLFDMGLSNVVRLHLHLKKPLEQLKMAQSRVIIEKMNQLDFGYYFAKYQQQTRDSDSDMLTGFHFLLGFF